MAEQNVDKLLNLAYDQVEKRIKQEGHTKQKQAKEGEVSVIFSQNCPIEDKYNTARFFKHLEFKKVVENREVKGFTFPIQDFNQVVHNGCKQQIRKKCVSTQTEQPNKKCVSTQTEQQNDGSKSPSIFEKARGRKQLYNLK